jgi:hypothetical protein
VGQKIKKLAIPIVQGLRIRWDLAGRLVKWRKSVWSTFLVATELEPPFKISLVTHLNSFLAHCQEFRADQKALLTPLLLRKST